MKYLFILFTFMFLSCGESENVVITKSEYQKLKYGGAPEELGKVQYNSKIDTYTVIVLDSCEYITMNAFAVKDFAFTHKGNCKFCSQRNVKQLSQNNN